MQGGAEAQSMLAYWQWAKQCPSLDMIAASRDSSNAQQVVINRN